MIESRTKLAPRGTGKQAEKSRATRRRVVHAVRDLISGGGFSAASSTRIAQEANVSWGVVQHHFGDKNGILLAILEQCSDDYADFMATMSLRGKTRSARIGAYVSRCWEYYCSTDYQVALEIVLAMRFADKRFNTAEALTPQRDVLLSLWRSVFADAQLDDEALINLIRHTYVVLSGLILDQMLEPDETQAKAQLRILCATLEAGLYGAQPRKT
jgi:AcrR family transcriptional regulator